jgi:hypothetical protein
MLLVISIFSGHSGFERRVLVFFSAMRSPYLPMCRNVEDYALVFVEPLLYALIW